MYYFLFFVYNLIAVPLLFAGAHLAAFFKPKIAKGLRGRRHGMAGIRQGVSDWPVGGPRVWLHVASMGEFEQAKPVLRALKQNRPDCRILLTFFSPSGYEQAHQFPSADLISYLPFDSYCRSRRFLQMVRPTVFVVVRHDLWPNYLWHLRRMGIPALLIDASLSERRVRRLRPVAWAVRNVMRTFNEIHAISAGNADSFLPFYPDPDRVHVTGDTRYDQVYNRTQEPEKIAALAESGLFQRSRCFIAGSVWPSDEKVVLPALFDLLADHADYKAIIVPHELSPEHLQDLQTALQARGVSFTLLSRFAERPNDLQVLVVDRMGILANLYALAELVYVGGSFGPGVHSVLEPSAHGCMVLFGPRYRNSLEAIQLQERSAGQSVQTSEEIAAVLQRWLSDPEAIRQAGRRALQLVHENLGASERIVGRIQTFLPRPAPQTGSSS
ncbi:hypothetical protein GX408_04035 [bacterium]|nr:hypothetical protein [bacterium]